MSNPFGWEETVDEKVITVRLDGDSDVDREDVAAALRPLFDAEGETDSGAKYDVDRDEKETERSFKRGYEA